MNSKHRLYVVVAFAAALLVLLLLWPSGTRKTISSDISTPIQPITPVKPTSPGAIQPDPNSSYFHLVSLADQGPEGKKKALDAAYHAPIDFWGKVVDQDGKSIEGADVKFTINNNIDPYGKLPEVHVQSDANGLFSLNGKSGLSLSIWVSKEGYYSTSNGSGTDINYALKGGMDQTFPDQYHPFLFVLKKKGKPANLIHKQLQIRIPKDGTSVEINLTEGTVVEIGHGDFKVQSWVTDNGKDVVHPYPWRCLVAVPGGGLQERTGELDFQAPANGYQPKEEVTMTVDASHWKKNLMRQYFLQIGGARYVRMSFWMHNGASNFLDLDYYLNPQAGDRNLETAQ